MLPYGTPVGYSGHREALGLRPRPRGLSLSGRDVSSPRCPPPEGAWKVAPGFSPGSPEHHDKPRTGTRNNRSMQLRQKGNFRHARRLTLDYFDAPLAYPLPRALDPKTGGVPYGKKVRAAGNTWPVPFNHVLFRKTPHRRHRRLRLFQPFRPNFPTPSCTRASFLFHTKKSLNLIATTKFILLVGGEMRCENDT